MRAFPIAGVALCILAACSPISTVTPQPTTAIPTLAGSTPASAAAASPAATQPAAQAPSPVPPPVNAAPVGLQVLSPADGSVVNTQQVAVTGSASPGSVVSVNDDIIVVGADGQFTDTVTLDDGPNVIEVIGSNAAGDQTTVELTVTYSP